MIVMGFYDCYGNEISALNIEKVHGGDNYSCELLKDGNISFVKDSDTGEGSVSWVRNDVITFYAAVENNKSIAFKTKSATCVVEEYADEVNENINYKIDVTVNKATLAEGVILAATLTTKTYNVTFSAPDTNEYAVYVGEDSTNDVSATTGSYAAGSFDFRVVPAADKDINSVRFNGKVITAADGKYTVTLEKDSAVAIAVKTKTYAVTAPTNDGNGFTYNALGETTVEHGKAFTFYVTPQPGYDAVKSVQYTVNNGNKQNAIHVDGNQYAIYNVQGAIAIFVDGGDSTQYNVEYPENGTGYTIPEVNKTTVSHGTSLEFDVNVATGYNVRVYASVAGGSRKLLTKNANGKWFVNDVTGDVVITVTATPASYKVTVDNKNETGVTTTAYDTDSVSHNGEYVFYVTTNAGIVAPEVTVTGGTLIQDGNKYTVTKITGDVKITIAKAAKQQYNVNYTPGTGYEFNTATVAVEHGSDLIITVNPVGSYKVTKVSATMGGKNVTLDKVDGKDNEYTIKNITGDVVVSAVATLETYKVTVPVGAGYTVVTSDPTTVEANGSFRFKLEFADNYDGSKAVVKVGDTTYTAVDGVYTISEIKSDVTISVTGVALKTFKANAPAESDAFTYTAGDNAAAIAYNGSYTFTIENKPGYRINKVLVNGNEVNGANSTYSVYDITKDLDIRVETVANTLTVTYESAEKNHAVAVPISVNYADIENSNVLKPLEGCIIHTFDGWYVGEAKVNAAYLKNLIADSDAAVTLTAKFSLNTNGVLTLEKTIKETIRLGENNFRVTFKTKIGDIAQNDLCVAEYVKVTGYGTFLSASDGADFNLAMTKLSARDMTADVVNSGDPVVVATDNKANVYNYYINSNYSWDEFVAALNSADADSTIVLRVNNVNKEDNPLVAVGWIELEINGQKTVILGTSSGSANAENVTEG